MKLNLARRAAMKALLGSPIAAKGIVQAAAAEVLGAAVTNSPLLANEASCSGSAGPEIDPLWELFSKHQRAKMRSLSRKRNQEIKHQMPVSVASKKSWSPAFKAHVTGEMMREYEFWDDFSEEGKIRALVSIGVLPKSLLSDD